jgi:hypothetical protein
MSTALRIDRGRRDPVAPPNKGRMLFVEDVLALYGTLPDGSPRRSRDWVMRTFAPAYKHKDGKMVFWWEHEALAWLDGQKARTA